MHPAQPELNRMRRISMRAIAEILQISEPGMQLKAAHGRRLHFSISTAANHHVTQPSGMKIDR